jgi:hypothetical protein
MSDVIITTDGAIGLNMVTSRMGAIADVVPHGGNTGDDIATSGGSYGGMVDQTYTIVVTKAGAAGVAEITVTGSKGDNSGPTIVTGEDTEIYIGNLGATVAFDFGADALLELGDQYSIACCGIGDLKWCAIGSGDGTFTDPENPPEENVDATALKSEFARVSWRSKSFLVEDEFGAIKIGNVNYSYADKDNPTNATLYEWRFEKYQGEAGTVKEIMLFFDNGSLRIAGPYAENGLYDAVTNPTGEVAVLGRSYGIKNIPDYDLKKDEPGQHELNIRYLLRTSGT